ncbi:MAG: HAMP domain-containing sensor histidine kinase [Gaiellaceae bacterium]
MIVFALIVAAATLAAGIVAAFALRLLPTLRLQLAGLALVAVALPLAAVSVSGVVMFHSGHDMTLLFVAAASSFVVVAAALLIARTISGRVERLHAAHAEFASGDLGARAPAVGPAELAELGASFNEMAQNLERLFDARRQLVAWASHDLRTPLASMQAMLEAVEDGLAEPADYLPAMREQVRALTLLVDDLFELARIDAGVLRLELAEAELDPLVRSSLRIVEPEARARGVRLEAYVDGAPPVRCAPEKVERVLCNLLANALRHTPSDGSIAVRVVPLASDVRVTIEDTGSGFQPGSVRKSGLGLAIARGLVELQGGSIWHENRPGGGASVSFTLPAA